jgi:hypothetical protein
MSEGAMRVLLPAAKRTSVGALACRSMLVSAATSGSHHRFTRGEVQPAARGRIHFVPRCMEVEDRTERAEEGHPYGRVVGGRDAMCLRRSSTGWVELAMQIAG